MSIDKGELKPGEMGFVSLGEGGIASGTATKEAPEGPNVQVMIHSTEPPDEVTTPTGAPLTEKMNPAHSYTDPALAERNAALGGEPAPESTEAPAPL